MNKLLDILVLGFTIDQFGSERGTLCTSISFDLQKQDEKMPCSCVLVD